MRRLDRWMDGWDEKEGGREGGRRRDGTLLRCVSEWKRPEML